MKYLEQREVEECYGTSSYRDICAVYGPVLRHLATSYATHIKLLRVDTTLPL